MDKTSLHIKLRNHIAEKIRAGEWKPGERLPGEFELARCFKMSRETVRKAAAMLCGEGLIEKRPKQGTFVSKHIYRDKIVTVVLYSKDILEQYSGPRWLNIQLMLEGFSRKAEENGVLTNIAFFNHDESALEEGLNLLVRTNVIGYVFPDGSYPPLVEALKARGLACAARTPFPGGACDSVTGDLGGGIHDAIAHLIKTGRKRIAIFTELTPGDAKFKNSYANARFAGYESAIVEAGLKIEPELIRLCKLPDDASDAAKRMLDEIALPDAVFAGTDSRAFEIMRVLKDAGLRIPEDVAVVGSNNAPACLWQNPPLATVDYPLFKMGEAIFNLLMNSFSNPSSEPVHKLAKCDFIPRKSCG